MELYSHSILMSTTSRLDGTLAWLAYELLEPETETEMTQYTKASDMWAFGMVVLV